MSRWAPDAAGRLAAAAFELFDARGYDETTVADIAAAAGLTQRTFFRYFADKREVLFRGTDELSRVWTEAIAGVPAGTAPMAVVEQGLVAVSALFADRHAFARMRTAVIRTHPHLTERELVKLEVLAGELGAALVARGIEADAATLAAQCGVTVFHVAFSRWVDDDDPAPLGVVTDQVFAELRALAAS